MKNSVIVFFLLVFASIQVQAQKVQFRGIVTDTLANPMIRATVMLLDPDSTLVDYTQTNMDGSFSFKNQGAKTSLIKVTYIGYIPNVVRVDNPSGTVDVGTIQLTPIATELMEVVIKAAKAPMKMYGDTIEYDISTFKVPEGSTVEDLLRRLPSIEVQRDGTVLSEGKVIAKVTVEGKEFFGGDPKTVTKNLPAEGVSKVQVFDHKSEEEILTGIQGENDDKAMNIELKEEFKNGGFGKIVAGYGTEDRLELKGNYNVFNDKHQFSLVGVGNNTGRNGLGWDDYQDFMGSSSFDFFSQNLEYGFGDGGGRHRISFGGGNNLESQIQSAFFTGSYGGYPRNGSGGANYNYDHDGNKAGARYFYNYNDNIYRSTQDRTTYYEDFASNSSSTTVNDDLFSGHRGELSLETQIDSLHTLLISTDLAYVNSGENNEVASLALRDNELKITGSEVNNQSDFGGKLIKTTALLRKSFMKPGRFLGLNMSYLYTDVNDDYETHSIIQFYNDGNEVDSVGRTDRFQKSLADKNQFSGNAMFSEPLSKKWFVSAFYNVSSTRQKGEVDVNDLVNNVLTPNDYLSRTYDNEILYQRAGAKVTFTSRGFTAVAGAAYKNMDLTGNYFSRGDSGYEGAVDHQFRSWLPYLSLGYRSMRSVRFWLSAERTVQEPSIEQLLPIVDDRNPLNIVEGNPELSPKTENSISLNMHYGIPVSGFRVFFRSSYEQVDNNIITEQTVDENLITYSKPVNYKGGSDLSGNIGVAIPIWGEKLRTNLRFNASYSESFSLVNSIENTTQTTRYAPSGSIDFIPNDWLSIYLNGSTSLSETNYSIHTSQDQEIRQHSIGTDVNLSFGHGLGLEASYDHTFYSNDRFGQDTSIPLINASVYWRFLKGRKGTLRLAAYDLLDKNVGISQYAGSNFISTSRTESLARYFMLSFTYDMRSSGASNAQGGGGGRHFMFF